MGDGNVCGIPAAAINRLCVLSSEQRHDYRIRQDVCTAVGTARFVIRHPKRQAANYVQLAALLRHDGFNVQQDDCVHIGSALGHQRRHD